MEEVKGNTGRTREVVMPREIMEYVTLKTIAERTGYSEKYLSNKWSSILTGIKPVKLVCNEKILFKWGDIVQRLEQPK